VKNQHSVSIFGQSPVVILSPDSIGANTVLFGAEAFHKAKNYEQSQILIKLYKDTTASRTMEQLKKSPPPSPLRYQGTERGVSNREGDTRYLCFTTLCRESIPAALSPRFRSLQWAATPKLTMIAGAGNFPSGSSRCESSLLNPTIAGEIAESSASSAKNVRNARKKG